MTILDYSAGHCWTLSFLLTSYAM